MPIKLDGIDRHILRVLQKDASIQNSELAQIVGLSPSPCLRRVKLLQEAGVIKRYIAIVDGAKVDAGLTLFSRIWFKAQDAKTIDSFIEAIQDMPEIIECHLMAGECDAWLRIVTKDLDSYRQFHAHKLTTIKAIQSVKTDVPMDTVKLTYSLPI